ncbi:hypothetical protein BpHYR1_006630 [Brachionus plicatilis]|uniref:Uncharacterized protein n=1 Tax=Brachionus plicatilis TaxID=10195 RepID=A0A3M7SF83_BRAPC|nr:hypothetical protein BpHYR1_006630 [Brachionus plicatilis]
MINLLFFIKSIETVFTSSSVPIYSCHQDLLCYHIVHVCGKDFETDPEPVRVIRKRNFCSPPVKNQKTKKTITNSPHKDPELVGSLQKRPRGCPLKAQ